MSNAEILIVLCKQLKARSEHQNTYLAAYKDESNIYCSWRAETSEKQVQNVVTKLGHLNRRLKSQHKEVTQQRPGH